MMWDAGWNVTTDTYRVLGDIDAKVICSLRRSSLDRALSKAVQVVFHASCGVSNAVLKSERDCLDALKRRGVALDVALVVRVMREAELAAQYNRAVCEAQARRTPVFFLWYEDLLRDPEPTFDALQRFLGVEPRRLKTRAQRIVSDGEDSSKWISNLKEVKAAAAAAAEADARRARRQRAREGRPDRLATNLSVDPSITERRLPRERLHDAGPPRRPVGAALLEVAAALSLERLVPELEAKLEIEVRRRRAIVGGVHGPVRERRTGRRAALRELIFDVRSAPPVELLRRRRAVAEALIVAGAARVRRPARRADGERLAVVTTSSLRGSRCPTISGSPKASRPMRCAAHALCSTRPGKCVAHSADDTARTPLPAEERPARTSMRDDGSARYRRTLTSARQPAHRRWRSRHATRRLLHSSRRFRRG